MFKGEISICFLFENSSAVRNFFFTFLIMWPLHILFKAGCLIGVTSPDFQLKCFIFMVYSVLLLGSLEES